MALIVVGFLAACGRAAEAELASAPMEPAADFAVEAAAEAEESLGVSFDEAAATSRNQTVGQIPTQEKLIIRTADMSIVVRDTEEAMDMVRAMVEENGGWVVNSNIFQYSEEAMTGSMTVRVPSSGFDSALEAIRRLAVEVERVSTSGQDVTEEYVDLSARLDNLEATAVRVRNFLDEARNVEEALEVNRELSRLEGEIEALKGRLQYLSQSAAFSTISIDFTPDELSQPIEVGGWRPEGIARDAIEALISALQGLVNVLIWLAIFVLPILLIIGIPVWLVVRVIRRRRQARSFDEVEVAAVEPVEEEETPG